jgi:DNA segregation ATPase FtsK/SpoIIIE, S-DNA-T family
MKLKELYFGIKAFVVKLSHSDFFLGSVFFGISVSSFLSLVSYTSLDESFNVISKYPVQNWLGRLGSYFSDFSLQYFGLSSFFIPFWTGIVSYDFFNKSVKSLKNRCLGFVSLLFSFGLLLSFLKAYRYYFEYPLGGYLMSDIFTSISSIYIQIIVCIIVCIAFVFSLLLAIEKMDYISLVFKKTEETSIKQLSQSQLHSKNLASKLTPSTSVIKIKNVVSLEDEDLQDQDAYLHESEALVLQSVNVNEKTELKDLSKTYSKPSIGMLNIQNEDQEGKMLENMKDAKVIKDHLLECLKDFGVDGKIVSLQVGPVITVYELEPDSGVRSARVIGLSDDIARYLKSSSCRITILSTKGTLGIEIPNRIRETVFLREVFKSKEYNDEQNALPITFGKTMDGVVFLADLSKMPHLLIAGTTGSGKSVGINAIIMSLLFRLSPDECKFIMIDPKMLELSVYDGIPHLLMPVVTDAKNAVMALKWVLDEMEARYRKMSKIGVRNISGYNAKVKMNPTSGLDKMPFIVVIVDEMADLMIVSGKAVEASIQRLSQMARAAGIHLILATQRPSVDVITGVIKANLPTRLSFQVTSSVDSRTILGAIGAEKLLGMGDMIFMPAGTKMIRLHAPFVADSEVASVVDYLKANNPPPEYVDLFSSSSGEQIELSLTKQEEKIENQMFMGSKGIFDDFDATPQDSDEELYKKAMAIVLEEKRTSISYLQRKLRVGFNKSAGMIERMEQDGLLGKPDDKGRRIINEDWVKQNVKN